MLGILLFSPTRCRCNHTAACRDGNTLPTIEPTAVAPPTPLATEAEPTSAATIQQDADRYLVTHFESVQAISTTTTTPSLLPMLLQSLTRNTDYKPLLEVLRSEPSTVQNMLKLHHSLSVLCTSQFGVLEMFVNFLLLSDLPVILALGICIPRNAVTRCSTQHIMPAESLT